MRWLVLLLLATAAFAWLMIGPQRRAEAILDRERAACRALLAFAQAGERAARDAGAYRLRRIEGGDLPVLFVAAPRHPGEDAVRWFATSDGKRLFQFDGVRRRAPPDGPDTGALRRALTLPEKRWREWGLPAGWEPCRTIPSP